MSSAPGIIGKINTLRREGAFDRRTRLNVRIIGSITLALSLVSIIMSYMNFTQRQFEMFAATVVLTVALICTFVLSLLTRDRKVIEIMYCAILSLLMIYFTLTGGNDGFAVLWTLLFVPFTVLIMGFNNGMSVGVFFEVFFIIVFWTPLKTSVSAFYSQTFLLRFPMLYTAFFALSFLAKYYFVTLGVSEHNAVFANEAKSEYLSRISRDLREPLDTILVNAKIGLKEEGQEERTERFNKILTSSGHISDIINDVVEMSNIEAGILKIKSEYVRVTNVIEECVEHFSERTTVKGIEILSSVDESLQETLIGDESRIRQVMRNLLSNAVKFTEKGQITVDAAVSERGPGKCVVTFTVADTGIGMSEEFLERVFTPFEQEDSYLSRKYQGSGLGLPISYNLVALMGGRMSVHSILGAGSKITCSIPFRTEADEDAPM